MPLTEFLRLALGRAAGAGLALALAAGAAQADSAAVAALREANRNAARGDWEGAFATAEEGGPLVQALVDWEALRDSGGEWREYARFIAAHPDWPDLDDLRANGETSIPASTPPGEVLAYFGDALPQTGQGTRSLARALMGLGREAEARALVEKVWLSEPLTDTGLAALVQAFPDWVEPIEAQRADAMLWRWRTSDAQAMLPLLSPDRQALVRARIALIRGQGNARDLLVAVPAVLRGDPGLAYDRFNHLAEDGDYQEAYAILRARTGSAARLGEPTRWAAWRAQIARWLMREGRAQEAYELASRHHLTEPSEALADNEWLAGYVALRYLDRPEDALAHFQASAAAVTGPISSSRAAYWQGRAEDALGRIDDAAFSYAHAARNQTAFYGLLASERLGLPLDPRLSGHGDVADWRTSGKLGGELTQSFLLLLAAGDRDDARRFALQIARTADRPTLVQFADLLTELHEPYLAVLTGKAAVERGIVVPAAYFPIHPLAGEAWPVETELALSIARRESEFNAGAASPVGAQGLMQLMPATAREVAGQLGLPYAKARLTDWEYNTALGTRYLATLEGMFGSSPVLVAAGYNAGPGRPRQWMAQRGDIRDPSVDVVDWIEHIPFAETRTYVMRVSESIPIYRARLTGETGPVRFTALLRGEPPLIRPEPRPTLVAAADVGPVERISTSSAPATIAKEAAEVAAPPAQAIAALPGTRPRSRPAALD